MKPTRNRQPHTQATKDKIALAMTGKTYSEERRKHIGEAREVVLTEEQLQIMWEKRYFSEDEIINKLDISKRVYYRYKNTCCKIEQILFLPRKLTGNDYATILGMCKAGVNIEEIMNKFSISLKTCNSLMDKLGIFYTEALPYATMKIIKPKTPMSVEGRKKVGGNLAEYNRTHIKKGDQNPNWRGGVSPLVESIRTSKKMSEWRQAVYKKDGFRCAACQAKNPLEAHHIYPFRKLIKDGKISSLEEAYLFQPLWEIDNGLTLCRDCHVETEAFRKEKDKNDE